MRHACAVDPWTDRTHACRLPGRACRSRRRPPAWPAPASPAPLRDRPGRPRRACPGADLLMNVLRSRPAAAAPLLLPASAGSAPLCPVPLFPVPLCPVRARPVRDAALPCAPAPRRPRASCGSPPRRTLLASCAVRLRTSGAAVRPVPNARPGRVLGGPDAAVGLRRENPALPNRGRTGWRGLRARPRPGSRWTRTRVANAGRVRVRVPGCRGRMREGPSGPVRRSSRPAGGPGGGCRRSRGRPGWELSPGGRQPWTPAPTSCWRRRSCG